jgi:hypothetical protein
MYFNRRQLLQSSFGGIASLAMPFVIQAANAADGFIEITAQVAKKGYIVKIRPPLFSGLMVVHRRVLKSGSGVANEYGHA